MKRKFLFISLLLALFSVSAAEVQDNSWKGHRIYGGALQYYYQQIFEENLKRYEELIDQAKTREDALKIVRNAQAKIKKTWRFPAEKSPLAPKVRDTPIQANAPGDMPPPAKTLPAGGSPPFPSTPSSRVNGISMQKNPLSIVLRSTTV